MSKRSIFVFGMAIGAWLNIWPNVVAPLWQWGPFVFAYILVFAAIGVVAYDRGLR